jgi:hypothetical protein
MTETARRDEALAHLQAITGNQNLEECRQVPHELAWVNFLPA